MKYSIVIHLIGVVMWLGSLMVLSRMLRVFCADFGGREQVVAIIRRTFFGFSVGGMIVTLVAGLFQLFYRGPAFYMQQGWFHGKLTLVLILVVVTVLIYLQIAKASRGELLNKARLGALHGTTGLMLLSIIVLTIFGRA